jgi:hypothetical protein
MNVCFVYGLLLLSKQYCFRYQTRTYIRLLVGVANSQPTMYAHPGSCLGRCGLSPAGTQALYDIREIEVDDALELAEQTETWWVSPRSGDFAGSSMDGPSGYVPEDPASILA